MSSTTILDFENGFPQYNYAISSDCMIVFQLNNKIHFKLINNQSKRIISLCDQTKNLYYSMVLIWEGLSRQSGVHGNVLAGVEVGRAAAKILQGDPILPGSGYTQPLEISLRQTV